MALTPEEQRELAQLQADQHDYELAQEGDPHADAHIEAVAKPPRPEEPETSAFSWNRVLIGGARDALQGAADLAKDLVDTQIGISMGPIAQRAAESVEMPELEHMKGEETAGTLERVSRAIVSFAIPFSRWSKAFKVAKAATWAGRAGRAALAGAATDLMAVHPEEQNLANLMKGTFGVDNAVLDALAVDGDDEDLVARLKTAATGIPVSLGTDALFKVGGKVIEAYRGIKGTAEEGRDVVEALKHDYSVKPAQKPIENLPEDILEEAPAKAVPSEEAFDPFRHVGMENPPESWEDVLDFLQRAANVDDVDERLMETLRAIVGGDPDNILTRLGLDPVKMDWSAFETPEAVRNLHAALTETSEAIAKKLGRTGETVTEYGLHTAARALASDAEVLKALYGKTSNLPEVLMGARMLVGGHARTLLDTAEAALKDLVDGTPGESWEAFLRAFHRHAFYLGSVRGAGSEIARALRSLQFVAKADMKAGKKAAEELAEKVQTPHLDAEAAADEQLASVNAITEDAEKISLLNTLLAKDGDIGDLSQFVRATSGSLLKRADAATKETLGNLFSQATAAFNIKSGLSMLGLRSMGRWLAGAARLGLAPFSQEQARLARVALMDAWAYTDGIATAWSEAVRNALAVMSREGASELFVNADNLGLGKLAKKAAEAQGAARVREHGVNFERVDLDARPRRFALNPADRRALDAMVESYDLPNLLERGLKFLARTAGAAINATGTITRTGTILFINAPDQFIGTMAAKAGAQSAAVRMAAEEAAELGLEGKALSKFLKARVTSLSSDVEGWANKGYEEGFRSAVNAIGENEARQVLFQDPLELASTRAMSKAHNAIPFAHYLVAFVHTPLRILERTAFDYTPIGLLRNRFRQAVLHGTPQQREQALTQMGLGMFGMYLGYALAADRTVVGSDGGFISSARLDRESYSMRIGSDVYEFVRDDPIGTILGMGADIHAYLEHAAEDPQGTDMAEQMFLAGTWAITANMLSKTWLESLKHLAELVGASTDGQFAAGMQRWFAQQGRRFMPGAGVQKGIEQLFDPYQHEALTFQENALAASLGAYKLPLKRDFLGAPVLTNQGERFTGLTWQPEDPDPLVKTLTNLSFRAPRPSKTLKGVKLNATQYSRWLELRGQEVVNPKYGLTMSDALRELVAIPEFKALRKEAQVAQIQDVMRGYSELATEALQKEDPELAKKILREQTFTDGRKLGFSDDELEQKNAEFGHELGLGDPL